MRHWTFTLRMIPLLALWMAVVPLDLAAAVAETAPTLPIVPIRLSRVVAGFPWAFDGSSRPPSILGLEGAVLDSSGALTLRQDIVLPGVLWQDTSTVVVGLHWLWSNNPDAHLDLGALPPDASPIPYITVGIDERFGLLLAKPVAVAPAVHPASAFQLPARARSIPENQRLVCVAGGPSFRLIPVTPGPGRTLIPPERADVPPLLTPVFTRDGTFDGFCLPFPPAGAAAGSWEWIPADEVAQRVAFLAANRASLPSGYLGVYFGAANPSGAQGTVYLRGVVPDSPADAAGLDGGDIVARIEGRPVRSPRQAVQLLRRMAPHDQVHVELIREGKVQRRTVTLGPRPLDPPAVDEIVRVQLPRIRELALDRLRVDPTPALPQELDSSPTMGLFLRGASAPLREAIGWDGEESALVALVMPGFPAAAAGLQAGDLLLTIADQPVQRVSDVSRILRARQRGETVPIRFFRQGRVRTVSVTLR